MLSIKKDKYFQQYIKYKSKYLRAKFGGAEAANNEELFWNDVNDNLETNVINTKFHSYFIYKKLNRELSIHCDLINDKRDIDYIQFDYIVDNNNINFFYKNFKWNIVNEIPLNVNEQIYLKNALEKFIRKTNINVISSYILELLILRTKADCEEIFWDKVFRTNVGKTSRHELNVKSCDRTLHITGEKSYNGYNAYIQVQYTKNNQYLHCTFIKEQWKINQDDEKMKLNKIEINNLKKIINLFIEKAKLSSFFTYSPKEIGKSFKYYNSEQQ